MKRMSKRVLSLCMATLLFAMSGCAPSTTEPGGDIKKPDSGASSKTNIIIALAAEGSTLDPSRGQNGDILHNVFEGLTNLTEDLNIEPCIAKSWKMSADEKEYTFLIDTSIKFANGDNVTVEDVLFSLQHGKADLNNEAEYAAVKGFEIVDKEHVKIILEYPCALLIPYTATRAMAIMNKALVEKSGADYGVKIQGSGTGPYDFVSWTSGVCIKLAANTHYRSEFPIKDVEYRFITEPSTGCIAAEAGDVDVYLNPNYVDAKNLEKSDKVKVYSKDKNGFDFLGFTTSKPPYNDVKVRQAIAYSYDYEELVLAAIGDGGAVPAKGFLPDFVFGYSKNIKPYPHDPAKAKELLKEAGYPNGLDIKIVSMDGARIKVAEYLQGALKESGINVEIQMTEWSKFLADLSARNLDAFIIGVSGNFPDADGTLYPQFITDGGQNPHDYSNKEVDVLLTKARQTSDEKLRLQYYEDVQKILMEELPCIPLYFGKSFVIVNPKLKNFSTTFDRCITIKNISW